ncbi:10740_t:CDS:2 [Funneliformis caledonium]|uniref:10740_t:CDS:1 n=1 Tax=Funneliformis caledonium TaxID=1117310 RepID=A0A9N9BQ53_9GLOM|nr:10740_t:CDS:2 [Funneliformis caledonium]
MARTVMHDAERLIKTAFNKVDSILKTDGGYVSNNEPKASLIITSPPKFRSYAHTFSLCYKSGDNSFDDYDEELTEASTYISPLNLANVDTPDYETTT